MIRAKTRPAMSGEKVRANAANITRPKVKSVGNGQRPFSRRRYLRLSGTQRPVQQDGEIAAMQRPCHAPALEGSKSFLGG